MGFAISDMRLTSPAFADSGRIPAQHTGEGEDVSPAFVWTDVPTGAKSFALVCHDPDAPLIRPGSYGFVHWVLYNIPGAARSLPEGANGYTVGSNDFGTSGYGGPMPPKGHGKHHYFFWLFALDSKPDLQPGLSLWELMRVIEPHVLGMNRLVGTYSRD